MAQYAIFMYRTEGTDGPGIAPAAEGPGAPEDKYDRHSDELAGSGAMVAAFALEDASTATSLRFDAITDGPFIEAKEVIVGVYVIEADDLDAALDMARANPILGDGGGLEVRPVAGSRVPARPGRE